MAAIRQIIRFTPFPPGFVGDMNKTFRALVDRIEVLQPFSGLTWQIGGLKPTSNIGPWLNDLGQPFFWDDDVGDYVPLDISLSLGDIQDQLDAAILSLGNYSTTAQMNTAISNAVGAINVNPANYPFSAIKAVPQVITAGADAAIQVFPTEQYDVGDAFASNVFTAPVSGIYRFTASAHVGLDTGSPTGVVFSLLFCINGGPNAAALLVTEASDDLSGKTLPVLIHDLPLSAGNTVDFRVGVSSTGASTWVMDTNSAANFFQGHLIQRT